MMFGFLSNISWTYYLIAGLVLALLASGYLLSNKIEEVGSLQAQNSTLTEQLATSEADKARLNATVALNAQTSLEDATEREKLRSEVSVLSKQITSLKRLTKSTPSDVKFNNQSSDDILLSDDLVRLLSDSYCKASPHLCPNTSQPTSGTLPSN
jgi:hypothetical protein